MAHAAPEEAQHRLACRQTSFDSLASFLTPMEVLQLALLPCQAPAGTTAPVQ